MPNKKDKTGRRVQIYLPAELLAQWDATPRYERSREVADALRERWARQGKISASGPSSAQAPSAGPAAPQQDAAGV